MSKVTCLECYKLTRAGNVRADGAPVTCAKCKTKAIFVRKRKAERAAKKGYLP